MLHIPRYKKAHLRRFSSSIRKSVTIHKAPHLVLQPRATSGIDIDHPLILKRFDSQASEVRHELPDDDLELALMELGILLLEIWNMKTF